MKIRFRHSFLLGLMLITALFSLVPTSVFAAGETAYLTPASGTSQPGNTFTVSIDGYVGQQWWGGGANEASGTLNFPASLLKVVSTSTSGSSYTSSDTVTPGSGTISFDEIANAWSPPANETVHLFSVTFQSLAAGTASVQFGTVTYTTGAAATTGGTYTIVNPPAPPKASPSPTPTPKAPAKPKTVVTTPAPTPTPAPTVEDTPAPVSDSDGGLQIEDVEVTATRSENSIAWSLNNPAATPTVAYGTDKNNLEDAGTIPQLADGSYKLDLKNLKLGTLYYFTIKAATSDGLQGANYSGVLTTRGYPVQLTIEENNLLIPGAKIKIGDRGFVANTNAIVTTELSDGKFTATITPPNETTSHNQTFTVKKLSVPSNGNPALQSFVINITTVGKSSGNTTSILPMIAGGVATIVAVAGIAFGLFFIRKKNAAAVTPQAVDVDTGQLQATYGANIQEYMTNTPEPNLSGGFTPPTESSIVDATTGASDLSNEIPANYAAGAVDLSAQQSAEGAQAPQAGFDPAALPLPPAATDTQAQDLNAAPAAQAVAPDVNESSSQQQVESYADQPTPEPAGNENEALTQELAKVESSEQIADPDEPSAVYDEATGELEIIHHHASVAALADAAPPADTPAATPEAPVQEPPAEPASVAPPIAAPPQTPEVPLSVPTGQGAT